MGDSLIIPVDKEIVSKFYSEIGLTEEKIAESLTILREWLNQQPHLPKNISDGWLSVLLAMSKNRLERAKNKLEAYYSLRSLFPDYFMTIDLNDANTIKALDHFEITPLPRTSPEGYRIYYRSTVIPEASRSDTIVLMKYCIMQLDFLIEKQDFSTGWILLFNLENMTTKESVNFTSIMAAVTDNLTAALPAMIKKIIFINAQNFIATFGNVVKSLLPQKLKNRIYFLSNAESLYEHIPKDLLPSNLGGKEKSSKELHEMWKNEMRSEPMSDYFANISQHMSDESKRTAESLARRSSVFGTVGSFRTNTLD